MVSSIEFSFLSFCGMSSSKRPVPDPILGVEVYFVALGLFVVMSKWSKIGLLEFESVPKFENRMRLPDVYRMSEDGVYPSSAPSFL